MSCGPARKDAESRLLALRQNHEVANRHMRRTGQHEEKRLNDVVVAQAAMRRDPTIDLFRFGQASKLVQNHPRRQRAYAHIVLGDLPAHAMNERLHPRAWSLNRQAPSGSSDGRRSTR